MNTREINSGGQSQTNTTPPSQPENQEDKTLLSSVAAASEDAKNNNQDQNKTTQQEDKTSSAPESYSFKLPEGITLDKEVGTKFSSLAKEMKLTNDQAQKIIDLQVEHSKIMEASSLENYKKIRSEWRESSIKELGSDYEKKLIPAAKAIDEFGGKDFRDLLDQTGLGDHPAMAKFLINIGKGISEDRFVGGGTGAPDKSDAELFYPSMKKK